MQGKGRFIVALMLALAFCALHFPLIILNHFGITGICLWRGTAKGIYGIYGIYGILEVCFYKDGNNGKKATTGRREREKYSVFTLLCAGS